MVATIRAVVVTGLAAVALAAAVARPLAQAGASAALPKLPLASTALLVVDPYNDFLSEGGTARNPVLTCDDVAGFRDELGPKLKQRGVDHIVLMGMRANTCIESTLREGVELGYHTTVLADAVAAFNPTELRASLDVNYPIYAHALLTTERFVAALAASK